MKVTVGLMILIMTSFLMKPLYVTIWAFWRQKLSYLFKFNHVAKCLAHKKALGIIHPFINYSITVWGSAAGVGDGKLEINKTQSLLSKCLQYGRRIRLHTKNHLKKVIWLILFHEARIGKRAFILKIQCLNTCCSRSWTRTIFHATVNHWE